MAALAAFEAGLCDCGFHRDLTTADDMRFDFEEWRCDVCAAGDRHARIQHHQDDERRGEKPSPGRVDAADGRKTAVNAVAKTDSVG